MGNTINPHSEGKIFYSLKINSEKYGTGKPTFKNYRDDAVDGWKIALVQPQEERPETVDLPLRKKTPDELVVDVCYERVEGMYQCNGPDYREICDPNLHPGAAHAAAAWTADDEVIRFHSGIGTHDWGYHFYQPHQCVGLCRRCDVTTCTKESDCPVPEFLDHKDGNPSQGINIMVENERLSHEHQGLPTRPLARFVKQLKKAHHIYLLDVVRYSGHILGRPQEVTCGIFGLLTFSDHADGYGSMVLVKFERSQYGHQITDLGGDCTGVRVRHPTLLKY